MTIDSRMPVLVGAAQHTQRAEDAPPLSPVGMLSRVSRAAIDDCGAAGLAEIIDTLAVLRFAVDTPGFAAPSLGRYGNPPRRLARALGARPASEIYVEAGGNTPQMTVTHLARRIAAGEADIALVAGGEALSSLMRALKSGAPPAIAEEWGDEEDSTPEALGANKPGVDPLEAAHGLFLPINTYPLFESAIRAGRSASPQAHMASMGRLFAPFTRIAAANPLAWFPVERTADEIATPSVENRLIGAPYTKFMNAVINVDMAAALVMMASGKADALGIPQSKRVYLHGAADAHDIWHVSHRPALERSPAIRAIVSSALEMAGKTPEAMDFLDLYSCFPSTVEIACRETGIAGDDPRGLTVTGGLPYFGGPGNAYSLHAIAEMMRRLRARPGAFGLVTANGWYLTKHAAGIYSTNPIEGPWKAADGRDVQRRVGEGAGPLVRDDAPQGRGVIEAYTVTHSARGPQSGIIIGRLASGHRFLANLPPEQAILHAMMDGEQIGRAGRVTVSGEKAIFTPEGLESGGLP